MAEGNVIITRHPGLVEWLRKHGIEGEAFDHVEDPAQVRGKVVYGILPMDLAAECKSVFTVDLPKLPRERRGDALTAQEMDSYGAKLTEYVVRKNGTAAPTVAVAQPDAIITAGAAPAAPNKAASESHAAPHHTRHIHPPQFPRAFVVISTLLLLAAGWFITLLCNVVHQGAWRAWRLICDAISATAPADNPGTFFQLIVSALVGAVFLTIMYKLWRWAFHQRISHRPVFWLNMGALLAAGVMANEFNNILARISLNTWLSLIIGVIVLCTLFWLANFARERIEMAVTPVAHPALAYAKKNPVQGLILLVSTHKPGHTVTVSQTGDNVDVMAGQAKAHITLKPDDNLDRIQSHIAALDALRPNWQQLLRAMAPHVLEGRARHLKKVFLVGSADSEGMVNGKSVTIPGSWHLLDDCKRWLGAYVPEFNSRDNPIVEALPEAVNFEDVHDVAEALRKAIKLLKKEGCRDEHILIDVTGGQKTSSVAGAAVTIGRPGLFQYVSTVGDCEASVYDMIWAQPPG